MVTLEIYKLDDQEETSPISILSKGEHIIGREKLNCYDKRVSRTHALIVINEDSLILKSIHVNPTFYKPKEGNSIQLLKKDNSITLNDGDQFSLLPQDFWFKIRITKGMELPNNMCSKRINEEEPCNNNKRSKVCTDEDNVTSQVPKSDLEGEINFVDSVLLNSDENSSKNEISSSQKLHENQSDTENVYNSNLDSIENVNNTNKYVEPCCKVVSDSEESKILEEPTILKVEDKKTEVGDKEIIYNATDKDEDNVNRDNDDSKTGPSTSKAKAKRDRCWYGDICYRKNTLHRNDYSHPGDSDYEENPDDVRDMCPFDDKCYRTNIAHRRQYKHSKPPAPKPVVKTINTGNVSQSEDSDINDDVSNNTQKRRKRRTAAKLKKYADSPEDDYDLDDPFLNDASSDDFEVSSDDSDDSDWQDSQEIMEESQETRRLLKEAKKFTKKRK